MNRIITVGAFLSTAFLLAGTFLFPASQMMWFASTSWEYTVFRSLVLIGLLVVLITVPPRHPVVRALLLLAGVSLFTAGIELDLRNSMHIFDILVFLQTGVILSLEGLELSEEEVYAQIERYRQPALVPQISWRVRLATEWPKFKESLAHSMHLAAAKSARHTEFMLPS